MPLAFSVTSRQPPQKCSLYFDKDNQAGCHLNFGFLHVMSKLFCHQILQKSTNVKIFYSYFTLSELDWKIQVEFAQQQFHWGILCYDWHESNKLTSPPAYFMEIVFDTILSEIRPNLTNCRTTKVPQQNIYRYILAFIVIVYYYNIHILFNILLLE